MAGPGAGVLRLRDELADGELNASRVESAAVSRRR
jgi:hypothetical protein